MAQDIILSSTTWTCPAGVISVQAECWGAGGGAGGSGGGAFGRPGGGGGAYSLKSSIGVTPASGYSATVGTGGALNTNGGDTSFVGDSSNTCLAKGGSCGVAISGAGGAGGVAASGTGDTKYSGGAGGTSTGAGGAGGGSSAGTGSAGANGTGASSATGGAGGTAPTGGGNGGRGGDDPFNGGKADGTVPGGGGGGASLTFPGAGASGANGKVILTYTAVSAPVADFSGTPLSGTTTLTVVFTDSSTNTPTSWDWDFGDGSEHGTTQNPSHDYSTAGTYTVTLIATNAGGNNTKIRTDYITVSAPTPTVSNLVKIGGKVF